MEPPLQMAYFRTWHDKVVDPTRPNSMGEIPAEVDVAAYEADPDTFVEPHAGEVLYRLRDGVG